MRFIANFGILLGLVMSVTLAANAQNTWVSCDGYGQPIRNKWFKEGELAFNAASLGAKKIRNIQWQRNLRVGAEGLTACETLLGYETLKRHPIRQVSVHWAKAQHHLELDQYGAALREATEGLRMIDSLRWKGKSALKDQARDALTKTQLVARYHMDEEVVSSSEIADVVRQRLFSDAALSNWLPYLPEGWQQDPDNQDIVRALHARNNEEVFRAAANAALENRAGPEALEVWRYGMLFEGYAVDLSRASRRERGEAALAWAPGFKASHALVAVAEFARHGAYDEAELALEQARSKLSQNSAPKNSQAALIAAEISIENFKSIEAGEATKVADYYQDTAGKRNIFASDMIVLQALHNEMGDSDQPFRLSFNLERTRSKFLFKGRLRAIGAPRTRFLFSKEPPFAKAEKRDGNGYGAKIFALTANGFKSKKLSDDLWRIKFIGDRSTEDQVREMALLRAAEIAKKAGAEYFMTPIRLDYTRTLMSKEFGSLTYIGPAGYQSTLFVRLLTGKAAEMLERAPTFAVYNADFLLASMRPEYDR